jgi:putative ABC transport system permease protein
LPAALQAVLPTLNEALVFALLALGVYVAFQWARFPDLTPDGAVVLSASVFAQCLLHRLPFWASLCLAALAGGCAGLTTAGVNKVLRVPSVVAGLLVSTALYSASLLVLGKPNQFLPVEVLFGRSATNDEVTMRSALINISVVSTATVLLALGSRTLYGIRLRAVGENPLLARDFASSEWFYTFSGLFISNTLVGLSGALFCMRSYSADVNMGSGMTVTGLAAMVLGRLIAPRTYSPEIMTACVVAGAIGYKFIMWGALSAGAPPESFRILTSLLLVIVFGVARRSDVGLFRKMRWS